jgi:hypothetical protein
MREPNRPGLLQRILPFGGSRTASVRAALLAALKAEGRLRVSGFSARSLRLGNLDTHVRLAGSSLEFQEGRADFLRGQISGQFVARLGSAAAYEFRGRVSRADLSAVAELVGASVPQVEGSVSGQLNMAARGMAADDLLRSLEGSGSLRVRDLNLSSHDLLLASGQNLEAPFRLGDVSSAVGSFTISDGHIRFEPLTLEGRQDRVVIAGDVNFSRALDLRIQAATLHGPGGAADSDGNSDPWIVRGTLDAPEVIRAAPVARDQTGASTALR